MTNEEIITAANNRYIIAAALVNAGYTQAAKSFITEYNALLQELAKRRVQL